MTDEIKSNTIKQFNAISAFITPVSTDGNAWTPEDVDKMDISTSKKYKEVVDDCRFFYRKDPIASSVINKIVDIAINEFIFEKNGLSDNEIRVFTALAPKLKEFAEEMALEYMVSGLVIPEIDYTSVPKDVIKRLGIKKYDPLILPSSMWLRDSGTITINYSLLGSEVSYFVEIPDDIIYFIRNKGRYKDGTVDFELYEQLETLYPAFVSQVERGEKKVRLENDLIFRRRVLSNCPYPTPYLYPALESLKHKRNLRRMDYSIASRVITAIQLFKLGNDTYPVTEDDEDVFDYIKSQMLWRNSNGKSVEKVFQLFAPHTLDVSWVFPDTTALLDETKYSSVNRDIIYALGLPQILIVGETERSAAGGNNELALFSPQKTMENLRNKILNVIKDICYEVSSRNNFKTTPNVEFAPLNLVEFSAYTAALKDLYDTGNISRSTYSKYFGYSFDDEMELKEKENKVLKEKELGEFAPRPFSPTPGTPGGAVQNNGTENNPQTNKARPKNTVENKNKREKTSN